MTKAKNLTLMTGAMALSLSLFGCGKQAFVVSSTTQSQKAPGSFNIPPKVDILLAEDDSGSIKPIYAQIAQQMPAFLNELEAKNWDYHFVTAPLTSDRSMDQVLAAKYDPNWGSQWIAPFPGALIHQITPVAASVFRTPDLYSGFLSYTDTSNGSSGNEQGFENIRTALKTRAAGTGFHRQDALLVVLVVGNGDDTSKVNYCNRGDGAMVPCESLGKPLCTSLSQAGTTTSCGSKQMSFDYYKSELQAFRPNSNQVRLFAAVSSSASYSCLGAGAYAGTRYMQMASALGGQSYDICTKSVSSVLESLSSSLEVTKVAMRTRYLFIERNPDTATLQVTKYLNGDSAQAISIPQDANNGWTFAGQVSNVYAIDYPIPMNLSSGYAIELHGSAKLTGDDTAKVDFKPAGWQNSAE